MRVRTLLMLDLYRRVPEIGCNQCDFRRRHWFLSGAGYRAPSLCNPVAQRESVQGRGLQEGGCCDCWLVSTGKVGREGSIKGVGELKAWHQNIQFVQLCSTKTFC